LWNRVAAELPEVVELDRCGTVWVAADEREMAEVARKHRFYGERGVATEVLDGRQVAEAEPNLRPGLAGGLRVPGDGVIYPPTAAAWLLARAVDRGAKRVSGEVVQLAGGRVTLADGTTLTSGFAVNAAGIGSAMLTTGIDVRPRKGHLVITDRYPGFVRHQLVELGYLNSAHGTTADSVAFNVQPRKTGQILVGSSRQYGSQDARVDRAILGRMIDRAVEYMPGLAGLSAIRVWTGFRPSTPDKLPLIGPVPNDPKLILATGHEGLGITTAMGTARLVADQLLGRASAIPGEPYLPARFAAAGSTASADEVVARG
jgi:D-hydroxyproline dehydrogenase subunit beta